MVASTLGRSFTQEIIDSFRQQGYYSLAQRLERLSKEGTFSQKKRIQDCWVILHFDIGDGWREDRDVKGFLQILNEMAKIGVDSDAARWWLKGAHDVLAHLVQ